MEVETDDKIVIHYPWVWSLALGVLGGLLVFILLYFPDRNPMLASAASALFLISSVAEKRRKLEISANDVAYWPPLGGPRRARFTDVISIEKGSAIRGLLKPYMVRGMRLELPNYEDLRIPLDLPNSDEIYDKIVKAWEGQRAAR